MKQIIKTTINTFKSLFLEGLFVILPITLTIALFAFFFKILKKWLAPLYQLEPDYLQQIPQSEIVLAILFILLVGLIFKIFLIKPLIDFIESVFFRIPLMNPVYTGIKQLVQAFTVPEKLTFQKVILVEFPGKGVHSIGFLTRKIDPSMAPSTKYTFYGVFVPTTPNPTTGYFIMVPEHKFTVIDITRHEAMSMIISGGIIQPRKKNAETTINDT